MNMIFKMPSWKTGLVKRWREFTDSRTFEAILIVLFFAMLVFMMVTPIVLAYYAPPMAEFGPW